MVGEPTPKKKTKKNKKKQKKTKKRNPKKFGVHWWFVHLHILKVSIGCLKEGRRGGGECEYRWRIYLYIQDMTMVCGEGEGEMQGRQGREE